MSVAQQLKDLRGDVRTLLEFAQTLKTENDSLRSALRGSVIFLRSKGQEKVIRGLAEVGAAFPRLKTGGDISPLTHNKAASHLLSGGGRPSSLPNTSELPDLVNGGRGDSTVKEVVEEAPNEGSPPELFATDDLVEVLLKHNKLLGRLHQFTAPNTDPSIPTSSSPNIGDHNLMNVGVVGFRKQQDMSEFVVHATWSNGRSFELYRKYLDFFTLQARLTELGVQIARIPTLPLSDHLLVVLGRLNSTESLYHRYKLLNSFCRALLMEVKGMEAGDICRTSVLVFFVPRPGDLHIENTKLEDSYRLETEGESDLDFEECLGFLSSVAMAEDEKWHKTHSDLLDAPATDTKKQKKRDVNLRFTKPSVAHPVLTHLNSAPVRLPTDTPSSSATNNHSTINLSVLKTSLSLDMNHTTPEPVGGGGGDDGARSEFRLRSSNILTGGEGSLTRVKVLCVKTGNMDWGVRDATATSNGQSISTENGTQDSEETGTQDSEETGNGQHIHSTIENGAE